MTGEARQRAVASGRRLAAALRGARPCCMVLADQSAYTPVLHGRRAPADPPPYLRAGGMPGDMPPDRRLHRVASLLWTDSRPDWRRSGASRRPTRSRSAAWLARSSSGAGTIQVARSDGILCRGCLQPIRIGLKMEVFREGFIHPSYSCRAVADRAPADQARSRETLVVPFEDVVAQTTPMAHNLQKQARVAEQLSEPPHGAMRACMDGSCPMRGRPEPRRCSAEEAAAARSTGHARRSLRAT